MIVLEQELNGYEDGLNGGFLKKIRLKNVSLKNAGKLVKASAMLGVGIPPKVVAKNIGLIHKNAPKANTMRGCGVSHRLVSKNRGLNGYDDGLNGFNLKKTLKKVNLKGAIKVVAKVAPMALSMVPVLGGAAGGVVGKVLSKVTQNKNGSNNLIGRAIEGQNGDGSANFIGRTTQTIEKLANTSVAKSAAKLAAPLIKTAKASLLQQTGLLPNDAQLEALAESKGTTAQQELDAIVASTPTAATPATKADYTIPILAVAGVGVAYMVFK